MAMHAQRMDDFRTTSRSSVNTEVESQALLSSRGESRAHAVDCGGFLRVLDVGETKAINGFRPTPVCAAWVTVFLSVLIVIAGVTSVPLLLSATRSSDFQAPADSPSLTAFKELSAKFPLFARGAASPVVLMVRAKEGTDTVLSDAVAQWSQQLQADSKMDPRSKEFSPVVSGYFLSASILRIHAQDELLQTMYVAHDRRATVVAFMATKAPAGFVSDVLNATWKEKTGGLMAFFREHMARPPEGCDVLLTGNPVMVYEREDDHSIENLLRAELVVLPIALAILALLVKEVRLLIIPPIVLVVTFAAASTILWPIGLLVPLSPDIPPAMLSLSVALCLDYSLFILTRFNEIRLNPVITMQDTVNKVLRTAGHTINVSGLLIAISFFAALTLPEENLRSAGLALGITTLVCMVVSTTLGAAMLLLFGNMLVSPSQSPQRQLHCPVGNDAHDSSRRRTTTTTTAVGSTWSKACDAQWVRLMRSLSVYPLVWVILVIIIFVPVLMYLPMLQSSADSYAVMPSDMPSVLSLRELAKHFPPGRFDPYAIVVTQEAKGPRQEVGVIAYNTVLELCDMVHDQGGVASMLAPMWLMNQRLDWDGHQRLVHAPITRDRDLYKSLQNMQMNGSSMLLQVHTSFAARGPGSAAWVENLRRVLGVWESVHPGYRAWLSGGATLAADARDTLMAAMPIYLGVSVVVIMAVVMGLFRSLFLTIRLGFAILFSLAASFGISIIVYQTPLLHGIWPWLANYSGITYEVIPLAAGVAVALGLDYDIFLVTRIVEYRVLGNSDECSIVKGVTRTGGIISGAGIIMALAFSGLFFSNKLLHQQFALLLVASVLLDTFIVRTVLVPALMLNARGMNWWPRKMPDVTISPRTLSVAMLNNDADRGLRWARTTCSSL